MKIRKIIRLKNKFLSLFSKKIEYLFDVKRINDVLKTRPSECM